MGRLFDLGDVNLAKALEEAAALPHDHPLSDIVGQVMELTLHMRQLRRHCLLNAQQINGEMWVRSETVLRMIDGG